MAFHIYYKLNMDKDKYIFKEIPDINNAQKKIDEEENNNANKNFEIFNEENGEEHDKLDQDKRRKSENIQKRIKNISKNMQKRIENLEKDNKNVQMRLENIEKDNKNIEKVIENIEKRIEDLRARIENIFLRNTFINLDCQEDNNYDNEYLNDDLEEIEVDEESSKKLDNKDCLICLEKFLIKDKICYLPCNHLFHSICIKNWIKIKKECPLCKRSIFNK